MNKHPIEQAVDRDLRLLVLVSGQFPVQSPNPARRDLPIPLCNEAAPPD